MAVSFISILKDIAGTVFDADGLPTNGKWYDVKTWAKEVQDNKNSVTLDTATTATNKDLAVKSAANAKVSEDNAKVSADGAATSLAGINTQLEDAQASAEAAKVSEDNAKISADNAKVSEATVSEDSTTAENASLVASQKATEAGASATSAANSLQDVTTRQGIVQGLHDTVVEKEALVNSHYDQIDKVSDISDSVVIVSDNNEDVSVVAGSIQDVNFYADTYYGPLDTAPTTNITVGDLYFDTVLNEMRVFDGNVWKAAGSSVNGTSKRVYYVAEAGQTTFEVVGGYDATYADVYINGRKLINGEDVDVTSGTNVVLTSGAAEGDLVDIVAYGVFVLADHYTKAEDDLLLLGKSDKVQDVNTTTVYTDVTTGVNYKLYIDNGSIVLEEV